MTRKQALTKLLQLGPLTVAQMAQIMGGCKKTVYRIKQEMRETGEIVAIGKTCCPVSRRKTQLWGIYE